MVTFRNSMSDLSSYSYSIGIMYRQIQSSNGASVEVPSPLQDSISLTTRNPYEDKNDTIDITDKAALKKVSTFNNAVARYIDDREFKTLLTSSLTSLKVSKKETDVIGVIVKTIIDEYKKYMEGFTRNLYIPRWI